MKSEYDLPRVKSRPNPYATKLKRSAAAGLVLLLALTGCTGKRGMPEFEWDPAPVIPLEEAQILITSGQVKEIFQAHEGCVLLTLHNGERRNFHQPYLDWVLDFLNERRLRDEIPLSME